MKTLESITIQDMLDRIFVNFNIQKRRKELVDFYIQDFGINLFGDVEGNISITANDIGKKIDNVLSEDRKSTNPFWCTILKNAHIKKQRIKGLEYYLLVYPIPTIRVKGRMSCYG